VSRRVVIDRTNGSTTGHEVASIAADPVQCDDRGMREKYLHSRAAVLIEDGRFKEAVRLLRKAVRLNDQPYLHHDLSLAFRGLRQLDKAFDEITKAIAMAPSVPEFYDLRADLRLEKGDAFGASVDRAASLGLDEEYRRISEIRLAAVTVNSAFFPSGSPDWADRTEVPDRDRSSIIDDFEKEGRENDKALAGSCPIKDCPAYCCHFTGDLVRHGVCLDSWKLHTVRQELRERELKEDEFIDRLSFRGETHLSRLVPPTFVINHRGERSIYYPRRSDAVAAPDEEFLAGIPKGRNYETLMWTRSDAKPCAFLHDRRCMIYGVGDDTSLDACSHFLCMTGFVFIVLRRLGIINAGQEISGSMALLNGIAVEALLALSRELYGNEKLAVVRKQMNDALLDALAADGTGDRSADKVRTTEYRAVRTEYNRLFDVGKERVRRTTTPFLTTLITLSEGAPS
jgi:hypothetical protein